RDGDGTGEDAAAEPPRPNGAHHPPQRPAAASETPPPRGLVVSRHEGTAAAHTLTAQWRVENPAPRQVCRLPAGRRRAAATDAASGDDAGTNLASGPCRPAHRMHPGRNVSGHKSSDRP